VIAVLLGAMVARDYARPEVVEAQGAFSGVQVSPQNGAPFLFDSRTGEIVWYFENGKIAAQWRLTKPGQPLIVEK
jgi:hypothetical protein